MVDNVPKRYPREGVPLGRSADDVELNQSYSTETPSTRRLWWRIRDVLRRPVRNSDGNH